MSNEPFSRHHALIFLHIPKTAGSTLERILIRQYRSAEIYPFVDHPKEVGALIALPEKDKARYKLFYGHMPYGVHTHLPRPGAYITFLREPVQVSLSSFFFFAKDAHPEMLRAADWSRFTLKDLQDFKMQAMFDNPQTRYLAGQLNVKRDPCTREMLELAKRNLERFLMIGLVEQFDVSIVLMSRACRWRAPYYAKANVTSARPRGNPPDEIVEWLRERVEFDYELYAYAETLFAHQVAAQGRSFETAVRAFQNRNRLMGRFFSGISRARNKAWRAQKIKTGK